MSDAIFDALVPERVRRLAPYQPGKPVEELERELGITGAVKLASNENPLGPSPLGIAAARALLDGVARYPDGGAHALRVALAARHGVTPDELVVGSGSNELIEVAVRAFCEPGRDEVVTHAHAFWMLKIAAQGAGVTVREAATRPDLGCDVDALADAVTPATRLVFLPNPNNPTGVHVGRADLERLLARLPADVVLIVDEAYHEYAVADVPDYPVAERYRAARPGIITLRTFSKAYGLAALRIGYALGDPRLLTYLDRLRMPFNTSSVAQAAARAALGDDAHVRRSIEANRVGRRLLVDGLGGLGLRLAPSATNFVLAELGPDALAIYEALLREGVIVRPGRPAGLPHHLRVSVGLPEENARAVAAFARVLGARAARA